MRNTNPSLDRKLLTERITQFQRREINDPSLKLAAVAIVVNSDNPLGEFCFLLTRRATKLNRHSGQFALPGGRVDAGESRIQAARRELAEELNIRLDSKDVIGLLDDYATRSGYCITPVVLWCDSISELKPNPSEVAQAYSVAIKDLGAEGNPILTRIEQSSKPVLSVQLATIDQQVFAPTAALLYQFHEVALCGRSTRIDDYDQPLFAWR